MLLVGLASRLVAWVCCLAEAALYQVMRAALPGGLGQCRVEEVPAATRQAALLEMPVLFHLASLLEAPSPAGPSHLAEVAVRPLR